MAPFDPRRLALARCAAGKTKSDLARDLGLSPASISQYEAGNTTPRPGVIAELALLLAVDPAYFQRMPGRREVSPASRSFFRSLRATRQFERDEADALSEHVYDVIAFVESRATLALPDLPSLPVRRDATRTQVEEFAAAVRTQWSVAEGRPIANVVRLMESRGVFVCRPPGVSGRVDAFSRWFDTRPLVVLSDDKQDKARSRFDATHELGHLVMHHEPEFSDRMQERQAHAFAAAFLMPAGEVTDHLPVRPPRLDDWEALQQAQRRWGVSIAALLYRAKELGTLTDSAFRRAMTRYNDLKLGAADGRALGTPETPQLLSEAVKIVMRHNRWGFEEFASQLCFTPRQLTAVLGPLTDAVVHEDFPPEGVLVAFPGASVAPGDGVGQPGMAGR
jgi:Zn-dependent peptidase ImmA (M78 family)/transcriptional regulator with XRE-family HTH domain